MVRLYRGNMSKVWACLILMCGLLLVASAAHAQIIVDVPAAQVAAALEKTLGETSVHLHSRGLFANGSFYATNASSIKIPAKVTGIPGQRTRFSLPDESRVFLGRRYAYYVDHVRSTGLFVTAGAETFTISITLASPGPALIGTCVRLRAPAMPCANLNEQTLPAVEWRDARIDVVLKPFVAEGDVALDVQAVVIGGTFDVGKSCEWPLFGARLCAALNRQSERVRARVAAQIKTVLNSGTTRREIAASVRQYIDTTRNEPLLGIRRLTMQDGVLRISLGLGR
jgi:hypothetical protein